jgi:hypothetical protein
VLYERGDGRPVQLAIGALRPERDIERILFLLHRRGHLYGAQTAVSGRCPGGVGSCSLGTPELLQRLQ